MHAKYWQIIKDDNKRTYEVCGQITNDNAFFNKVYAMQKAGMNVSGSTPPVTNKTSSKSFIKIAGYQNEDGLLDRLSAEYSKIIRSIDQW